MNTTRVMSGLANLEGTKTNTLQVSRMVSRQPEPRYACVCGVCKAESTQTHTRLRNGAAVCRNSACGKTAKPTGRDLIRDQRRIAAERQAEAERAALEAIGLRMAAELADDPREQRAAEVARTEAERLAAEHQSERERREQERKERQRAYWREYVENDRDPKLYVSPEMATASMPSAKVAAHNTESVNRFIAETPEFASEYKTPENAKTILAYLERNGVKIFDAPTLKAAFVRLRDLAILTQRKTVEPEKPKPAPARVNLSVTPAQPTGPQTYMGRDPLTGRERAYTSVEVDRMSSAEYRRAFPVIDSVGELFTTILDER